MSQNLAPPGRFNSLSVIPYPSAGLFCMLARSEGSAAAVAHVEVPTPARDILRVETDRTLEDGTRRRVVLVLRDGAWRVDRFAL